MIKVRYLKKDSPSNLARKVFETRTKSSSLKNFNGILDKMVSPKKYNPKPMHKIAVIKRCSNSEISVLYNMANDPMPSAMLTMNWDALPTSVFKMISFRSCLSKYNIRPIKFPA